MKARSTKDIALGPIKIVVYGRSGAGKTSLAKTLPGKPVIISAESGLLSLGKSDIPYFSITERVRDDGQVEAIPKGPARLVELRKILDYLKTGEAMALYDVIFVDSITEIGEAMYDYFKDHHAQLAKQENKKFDKWAPYADLGEKLTATLKELRDLPHYSVVVTALEETDKDESGKRFLGPDLPGKVGAKAIVAVHDFVFRLATDEKSERYFLTSSTATEQAKARGDALSTIEPADLGYVFAKIRANCGAAKEETT